ncbi:MAG: tyrosine recombinase XerD [Flavobacteriaceae bacterium]|nr:tyrosine recombinase XerD [Flavobacteriaceae bacterium]
MNWQAHIKDYKLYLKIERGLSINTIISYVQDVEKLALYIDDYNIQTTALSISKETIKEFIYDCSKKISASSQARLISGLRNFFDYLVFEAYRKTNPTDLLESPKLGRKLPDTLSVEEIDKLLASYIENDTLGLNFRNKVLIECMYSCGLRVSELIQLRKADLYFEEGFIRVIGKGNKERYVPIYETTQALITQYIQKERIKCISAKTNTDVIFLNRRGKPLSRNMIFIIVKRLAEINGIKKNISPHTFRHSFASHLLSNGADLRMIQEMLGHESITTTEIYLHLDRKKLSEVINLYHPRKE